MITTAVHPSPFFEYVTGVEARTRSVLLARQPMIVVATLLGGEGATGVEGHFHLILNEARRRGYETRLVTPYTGRRLRRAPFRILKNLPSEWGQVLYRRCQARVLTEQLRAVLSARPPETTTIYAQCPLSAAAAAAARRGRARVVAAVHFNISEASEIVTKGLARPGGPWCRHLTAAERDSLPRVDHLVFVSDFMRRTVNARLPALKAVPQTTLFNFPPAPISAPDEAQPTRDLVAIGALEPRKNQAYLLHVLQEAKAQGRRYTLTLVGDGPERPALERLTKQLDLTEQVDFRGVQPHAAHLIRHHRAFAHAATAENCPLSIVEALSYGRPVLAAPVGGIPELFDHGVEGFQWPLHDPAAGATQLRWLLDDEGIYTACCRAAFRRYQSQFADLPARWIRFLSPGLQQAA